MSPLGNLILYCLTFALLAPIVFYLYVLHREHTLRQCRGRLVRNKGLPGEEEVTSHVRINSRPRFAEFSTLKPLNQGLQLRSFTFNYFLSFDAVNAITVNRSWMRVRLDLKVGDDAVQIEGYYAHDIIELVGIAKGRDLGEALAEDFSPFNSKVLVL